MPIRFSTGMDIRQVADYNYMSTIYLPQKRVVQIHTTGYVAGIVMSKELSFMRDYLPQHCSLGTRRLRPPLMIMCMNNGMQKRSSREGLG